MEKFGVMLLNMTLGNFNFRNNLIVTIAKPFHTWLGCLQCGIGEVIYKGTMPERGSLIAVHHELDADPMVVQKILKRHLYWIASPRILKNSTIGKFTFFRKIMGVIGVIVVSSDDPERNRGLFDFVADLLSAGETVVIFPEGKLRAERNNEKIGKAKHGVIRLAQYTQKKHGVQVCIYPVGLGYNSKKAYLNIGNPFKTSCEADADEEMQKLMQEITKLSDGEFNGRRAKIFL
jgi:1-acyl-sn-glycerol-3-phosphate acyltransferase